MARRFGTGNDTTVFVDGKGATRFACRRDIDGALQLAPDGSLANRWIEFHERGRPTRLGRGPSANAKQRPAPNGHEPEEMAERYARDLLEWIERAVRDDSIDRVRVFAGPSLVGTLRPRAEALAKSLGIEIECRAGEFPRLDATSLVRHPAVVDGLE